MIGVALRSAASSTSRPGRRAEASARARAWRRMLSARPFSPPLMIVTTKRSVVRVRVGAYFALRGVWARRGTALLLPDLRGGLGAVLGAALLAVAHAGRVKRAADDVVLDRGEVLHPAAAHEHDRVLLQVVADARDVGRDLHLVGEPHARDLAQRRVRFLGRHRAHLEADATLLRGARDRLLAVPGGVPGLAHGRRLGLGGVCAAGPGAEGAW